MEMSNLCSDEKVYTINYCYDLPMTENQKYIRNKFTPDQIKTELDYIQSNLICDKNVRIKVGSQVMCIVNVELMNGEMLCNGSQGVVTKINENNIPFVKFNNGVEMMMSYHVWPSENIPGIGVSQIPLILAWALTIHKSQGASLDVAEIDVGSSIFESGQTYVALSRVKSLQGLYLTSFDVTKIRINKKVREFYENINRNRN
jgi:ATP-dependent DNA helicase PIF1